MDKSALRQRYRQERALLNPRGIDVNNWRHLLSSAEVSNAKVIASYNSYGDEPNTEGLNQELIKLGKVLVLPRLLSDMDLEWVVWDGDVKNLRKSRNFHEPIGEPIDKNLIDLVIVPTLHINLSGYRLGQGGGSYDRALPKLRALRVGLIYSGEITDEEMFVEPHDQKLDLAATPEIIIRF